MRSDEQYLGIERSLQRAWAKGAGLIDEEFERPMIAVVNTCQEFSPENIHLRQVGDAVKSGIRMAGGTPCEFNTFHVTDSETFASVGMRYVLPSRDLVADMIELMVEGHRFDAMVLIGSGDKVVPGMVMAAARLDLPSILLYGGPTRAGVYRNRKVFLETVYDGVGEHLHWKALRRGPQGSRGQSFSLRRRVRHRDVGQHRGDLYRGPGPRAPQQRHPAGRQQLPAPRRQVHRHADHGAGEGRRPSFPDSDAGRIRERHARRSRRRRLDQHGAAHDRDGEGSRSGGHLRHLGPAQPRDADPRQAGAFRALGGDRSRRCRRRSRGHEGARRPDPHRHRDRQRRDDGRSDPPSRDRQSRMCPRPEQPDRGGGIDLHPEGQPRPRRSGGQGLRRRPGHVGCHPPGAGLRGRGRRDRRAARGRDPARAPAS